jgi:UDPglucose 6-dehydrogenase
VLSLSKHERDFPPPTEVFRFIIGADDERARLLMRAIYAPFSRNRDKLLRMDTRSAELTKYAAKAMLATRICFMNERARLAERVGADVERVRHGIGSNPRIGTHFLYAGTGYGGSCFPKDVKALVRTGHDMGIDLRVRTAAEAANDTQKRVLVDKVVARFGEDLHGRRFALWGLAFKADTDDLHEAPSRVIVHELLRRGAAIRAYDPVAMDQAQRVFGDLPGLTFASHQPDALRDADALRIVTEWRELKSPDFEPMRALLKELLIFDGRNLFDPALVRSLGFEYYAIGRGEGPRGGAGGVEGGAGTAAELSELAIEYTVTEFQAEKVQDATGLHVQ